jgi:flagellar hook-associated protein 2
MPIQPLTFTGVSSLSESLQSVLSRAVSIASIPLKQLQSANTDILQKKVLLTGLGTAAEKLGAAVSRLGTVASGGALSAFSSNASKITVLNTGITRPVSYTISNVSSLATAGSAVTGSFADVDSTPVSATGRVQLEVDGKIFGLALTNNTLAGLRDAINEAGAGVTATILTAGPGQHHLSLSANSVGVLQSLRLGADLSGPAVSVLTASSVGSDGSRAAGNTAVFANAASDAVSATGELDLVVGAHTYRMTLADNTLAGLRDAINALGAGVTAEVVLDGEAGHLSVRANGAGAVAAFQLIDDPTAAAAPMFAEPSLGSNAVAASGRTAAVVDVEGAPVSASGRMLLVLGTTSHTIDLAGRNSLSGLRDAINGLGAGVTASLVEDGGASYLSVVADVPGVLAGFDVRDQPVGPVSSLLDEAKTDLGSNAVFKLNGIDVVQKTNTVNSVVPGMTFTLLGTTGESEKITLRFSSDRGKLAAAVSEFVEAYNQMQDLVGQQVGRSAGLLTGAMVVRDIQYNLRVLAGYSADGQVKSLAEIGITFDQVGKISFDSGAFMTLSDSRFDGALEFFGSSTTGFGALARKFAQLTDPVTGSIRLEQDGFDRTDRSLQSQIATLEERINAMQIATAQRLQLADALLAQLESQQSVLEASIKSVNLALFGKSDK